MEYIRLTVNDCLSRYRQQTSLSRCMMARAWKSFNNSADWSTYDSWMSNWWKMSIVAGRRIKRMQWTKEEGPRHKAVRVEEGESGRAIGARWADATREGGDIRMSSSSSSAKAIPPYLPAH